MSKNLTEWLSYIEGLHPKSIAMGLDRVLHIIKRLQLTPNFPIITVAGTNGKGSTCALLEGIYIKEGYQVGCYTSPHLLNYNERVRINGIEVTDEQLCKAFETIDDARVDEDQSIVQLTYFEVGTLAALWIFMQSNLDIAILEIGLGGRLDAVNAFEPSCAVVTSVDLDHQEFLGYSRASIGFEKAGIYRTGTPAICGDENPPGTLTAYAKDIQADFMCIGQDFTYEVINDRWQYQLKCSSKSEKVYWLSLPKLCGTYQLNNASCAITAVESLQSRLSVSSQSIEHAVAEVVLKGRFQTLSLAPLVILDVAHNPHAASALAKNLNAMRSNVGKTLAVFGMLSDKDIENVVKAVKSEIDIWYVASINHPRGGEAKSVAASILKVIPHANVSTFENVAKAYEQACIDMGENDKIIAFGSFFTVSFVLQA